MLKGTALYGAITMLLVCTFYSKVEAQVVNIPRTIELHEKHKVDDQHVVQFYYHPYRGPDIRVAELIKNHPELNLPDTISIIPPDISSYQNVYVFMGVIEKEAKVEPELVIMLVGNYLTKRLTFFTDEDFDRDFTDEYFTTTMRTGDKPRLVQLRPWGEGDLVYDLWLSVDRVQSRAMLKRQRIFERVRNQFSISPQVTVASGELTYSYMNEDIGFPSWYSVNSTAKSIGVNVDYTYEFLRFSAGAAYQNLYYWTSYLKVRTGQPSVLTNPRTGVSRTIPNVTSYENRDKHAQNRLEFSAKLAIVVKMGKIFDLQPFVKGGIVTYSPDQYQPNQYLETQAFREGNDKFLEAGLQLDVTSGVAQSAYVGLSLHKLYWQPEGFFESINHSDLKIRYHSIRFFAGYRFGL